MNGCVRRGGLGKLNIVPPRDKRASKRRAVVWPARMLQGRVSYACILFDLSTGGAKLRFDRDLTLTRESVLISSPRLGELWADIVHMRGTIVGVRFQGPPEDVAVLLARAKLETGPQKQKPWARRPRRRA
ncbi:MAG: PilZ domain-containing protein [Alphaproteobacteria bacterium]